MHYCESLLHNTNMLCPMLVKQCMIYTSCTQSGGVSTPQFVEKYPGFFKGAGLLKGQEVPCTSWSLLQSYISESAPFFPSALSIQTWEPHHCLCHCPTNTYLRNKGTVLKNLGHPNSSHLSLHDGAGRSAYACAFT